MENKVLSYLGLNKYEHGICCDRVKKKLQCISPVMNSVPIAFITLQEKSQKFLSKKM